MRQTFVRVAMIGTALTFIIPTWAQRGAGAGVGAAVGHATGSGSGTATAAANSASNVNPGAGNHGNASHEANAGGISGSSGDVSLRVSWNQGLSRQLQPLLPVGTTLAGAAAGFRNQGQFVSALHVAHNLNIPFDQLKAKVTGTNPVSLGTAIEDLRPNLDHKSVKDNVKLANGQAERDLHQSEFAGKTAPFVSRIASNTALASRLQALLPPGNTLQSAAAGFKNEGQFIAALEAAKTLNLSFADLKDRVTAGQSLGQAIHALRPTLTEQASDNAVTQAEEQSKDLRTGASESAAASSRR
jgi:hypothetical protein